MSKHSTRKAGSAGKASTMARKAKRATKFATAPLDIERIMSTLDRPLMARVA